MVSVDCGEGCPLWHCLLTLVETKMTSPLKTKAVSEICRFAHLLIGSVCRPSEIDLKKEMRFIIIGGEESLRDQEEETKNVRRSCRRLQVVWTSSSRVVPSAKAGSHSYFP